MYKISVQRIYLKLISSDRNGKRFLLTQRSVTHRLSVPAQDRRSQLSYRTVGPLVSIVDMQNILLCVVQVCKNKHRTYLDTEQTGKKAPDSFKRYSLVEHYKPAGHNITNVIFVHTSANMYANRNILNIRFNTDSSHLVVFNYLSLRNQGQLVHPIVNKYKSSRT